MRTAEATRERIARHGFPDRACTGPPAAAALTCGLQAQDNQAARFGVRSRASTVTEAQVVQALTDERSVARTWLMRGTIHLVDTRDLRWLIGVIGPSIARKFRTRWKRMGLSPQILSRTVDALPDVLAAGPRTRHEIFARLGERGIRIDTSDPQAPTHVLLHASTVGLVCRAADSGREATFALLDQWLPDAAAGPRGDEALAELARRYFAAYSPATTADFTTWSGLPSSRAVGLIRDELNPLDIDGRAAFRLGVAPDQPDLSLASRLRLLGGFDNYLLGYRDRDAILAPALRREIYEGGVIRPAVLLDGQAVGRWTLDRGKAPGRVRVQPFRRLTRPERAAVEDEVADIGRFIDAPTALDLAAPLV